MYLPSQFDPKDPQVAIDIMQAHPFASLISTDDAGLPFVTHLPVHWEAQPGQGTEHGVLLGHCARGNPHWKYLAQRSQAVVTFMVVLFSLQPVLHIQLFMIPTRQLAV